MNTSDKKISLMIVDDHKIFRDGLKLLLSHFPFVGDVYEASNGVEFLDLMKSVYPDIVLMDINMPVMGGIEATRLALEKYSELKIIVLTTFHNEDYVEQMMLAGVEGYMLKRSSPEEFETALTRVYEGGNYFSDEIVRTVALNLNKIREESSRKASLSEFTEREQEVLELICKGLNNEQIGELIHISPKTIEKHKTNLFQKTDTNNTVNLIIHAFRNGLVKIGDY
ncbi:MAG: response regulator transcription factor [Bacteroidales bacterium]|nr:response regulator transcription factor [Bacteroidales bacterium]